MPTLPEPEAGPALARAGGRRRLGGRESPARRPPGARDVFSLHLRGDTCPTPASPAARAGHPALGERALGRRAGGRARSPGPTAAPPRPAGLAPTPPGGPRPPVPARPYPACGRRLRALPVGADAADVRRARGREGRAAGPAPPARPAPAPGCGSPRAARGAGPRGGQQSLLSDWRWN